MEQSAIAEFYKRRSIFVTGGTGFMGKILISKLLHSCTEIERIYVLVRSSKGKTVECRLRELTDNQIFEEIKKHQPEDLNKIVAVDGDVTLPGFGLSGANLELLIENVSIVFNVAATVRFDEELKAVIKINVKGPMELLEICRQMKGLEAFVHVSTAFLNLDQEEVQEEIQHSTVDPVKLANLLDSLDGDIVKKITKGLIGNCPNTYTYTKALTEQLLDKQRGSIPLVIVRPSGVTAALKEPYPGWIDSWNGPTGTMVAVGKGFFRVLKMDENMITDIIPVDFSINLMIAAAWYIATRKPDRVVVFNSTTSHQNPLTYKQSFRYVLNAWMKFPLREMLWYPSIYMTTNDVTYSICRALFHYLPAFLLDVLYASIGKRMKWVRMYRKAHRILSFYDHFTLHQWRFISNNTSNLLDEMSPQDRQTFYFDVRQIEWRSYFETFVLGIRRFMLNVDSSTLTLAKRYINSLYIVRLFLYFLPFSVLVYLFKKLSGF